MATLTFIIGLAIGWGINSAWRWLLDFRKTRIDTALLSRNGRKARPVKVRRKL